MKLADIRLIPLRKNAYIRPKTVNEVTERGGPITIPPADTDGLCYVRLRFVPRLASPTTVQTEVNNVVYTELSWETRLNAEGAGECFCPVC